MLRVFSAAQTAEAYVDPISAAGLPTYASVSEAASALNGPDPVHCIYPRAIHAAATRFLSGFPGDVFYAVKCNAEASVLRVLHAAGVRDFDVASLKEIEIVQGLFPDARCAYLHPVKPEEAIAIAYERGVRIFSLDSAEELEKITRATNGARDLTLIVRIAAVQGNTAAYSLAGKFGCDREEAIQLLRSARFRSERLGLSFHVGSQSLEAGAYTDTLALAASIVEAASVPLDVLDIGGGFPSRYPGMVPLPLEDYFAEIALGLDHPAFENCVLWAEPGRALVADGGSTLVRVEARRGEALYINDGTYGSLFDAGTNRWPFPAARVGDVTASNLVPYAFWGPTCDSLDRMDGPFHLPDDMKTGDWIEVGQLGAYGTEMRTRFNGFFSDRLIAVDDLPLIDRK